MIYYACVCIALAMLFNAVMDWVHFIQGKGEDSFWKIHSKDTNDAWHWGKKLMFFMFFCSLIFMAYSEIKAEWWEILIFGVMIYGSIIGIFHRLFYHLVLKKCRRF